MKPAHTRSMSFWLASDIDRSSQEPGSADYGLVSAVSVDMVVANRIRHVSYERCSTEEVLNACPKVWGYTYMYTYVYIHIYIHA